MGRHFAGGASAWHQHLSEARKSRQYPCPLAKSLSHSGWDRMTFNCGNSVTKVRLSLGTGFYNHGAITDRLAFRRAALSLMAGIQKGKAVSDWLASSRARLSLIGCLSERQHSQWLAGIWKSGM